MPSLYLTRSSSTLARARAKVELGKRRSKSEMEMKVVIWLGSMLQLVTFLSPPAYPRGRVVVTEGAPVPAAVPEISGIQPSYTEEDSISCIACVLGIGHGVYDVQSDDFQVENTAGDIEIGSEVSAPVLIEEEEVIDELSEKVNDEENENVIVQNEISYSKDIQAVAEQTCDSSAIVVAPVQYANASTTTDDISYVFPVPISTSEIAAPSPSVSTLPDIGPAATSLDAPVDAHNEVSTEVRAKTLTALINEAVARISDATGLPPSAIIQFAADLYSQGSVPSAAQPDTSESPTPVEAPVKDTAEISIQTDDGPVGTEQTDDEVEGFIISPMTKEEREQEFELIDRVMRGARARKRAALDVGEQMICVCVLLVFILVSMYVLISGASSLGLRTKFSNEKYIFIIQKGSIPNVFNLLPPKPIAPVFEMLEAPNDPVPPPPPPPGPPPPPPPAALAPPPLASCAVKTIALPPSSDTPAPADPSSSSATPAPPPNAASDKAAQEAAKAKARAELRAAIVQGQQNGYGLRSAQDRVLRPAEPQPEAAPWQQDLRRSNGGAMGRTDNTAGPSQVQQESETETEPQLRFQLRATGRSLVDAPVPQTRSGNTLGGDINNLRANLRRVGNEVGNENRDASGSSRKGKGVVRPPLRSLNGPRDGST